METQGNDQEISHVETNTDIPVVSQVHAETENGCVCMETQGNYQKTSHVDKAENETRNQQTRISTCQEEKKEKTKRTSHTCKCLMYFAFKVTLQSYHITS